MFIVKKIDMLEEQSDPLQSTYVDFITLYTFSKQIWAQTLSTLCV